MKKKMRDLTDKEMEKICDKNYQKYGTCYDCPLQIEGNNNCFKYFDLDQEIEVEEDD